MMAAASAGDLALDRVAPRQERSSIVPRDDWRATYAELADAYALAADALRPVSHALGTIAAEAAWR
jgi:hypothetical protein